MDHGDGRFASRFRPGYDPTQVPRVAGLCVSCLRTMWTRAERGAARGVVVRSPDGIHCQACARYIAITGGDPRDKKGSAAERIPQERAEIDRDWRDDPRGPRCEGVGSEVFAPDPFPEELARIPEEDREATWETRRFIAEFVCAECPVRRHCARAALDRAYEGLWGGRFYYRKFWQDIQTGVRGPTHYTSPAVRERMVIRLRKLGLDEAGEPIDVASESVRDPVAP